jgi:hypothetical protein
VADSSSPQQEITARAIEIAEQRDRWRSRALAAEVAAERLAEALRAVLMDLAVTAWPSNMEPGAVVSEGVMDKARAALRSFSGEGE